MTNILCTHPGKFGDLLWALPTIRALAEAYQGPIDLQIPAALGSIAELLIAQPYIGAVRVDDRWVVQDTAPASPREPPGILAAADRVCHLGYAGWPGPTLAEDVYLRVEQDRKGAGEPRWALPPLDLGRPWITVDPPGDPLNDLAIGFTDEWFELKYGVVKLAVPRPVRTMNLSTSPRWEAEGGVLGMDWLEAAEEIAASRVFLGCCSALHVLAVALGTPVVIMEPNPQRHHPTFYPLGMTGRGVEVVMGNDGRPTFDARAVGVAVVAALEKGRVGK